MTPTPSLDLSLDKEGLHFGCLALHHLSMIVSFTLENFRASHSKVSEDIHSILLETQ